MYETTVILKIALDVLNLTYGLKNNKKHTLHVVHSRAWTPKNLKTTKKSPKRRVGRPLNPLKRLWYNQII